MKASRHFQKLPPSSYQLLAHMHPHIRISPFVPREWERLLNTQLSKTRNIAESPSFWLNKAKDIQYYDSGRTALLACLKHLRLKSTDEVLIETTTGGKYISSCVTETIEKICWWSQKISNKTKLILVIHEFGFPYPQDKMKCLKQTRIPILEDCAYGLGTRFEGGRVGIDGDFALYSLTKYFPVPLGGFLVSRKKINSSGQKLKISFDEGQLLQKTINASFPLIKSWNKIRRENWEFFARRLKPHQCSPYFPISSRIVPGSFVAKVPAKFPGEKVKKRLNEAGVESTQYYHMGGFYFPVHQFLTDYEKEYILQYFLRKR